MLFAGITLYAQDITNTLGENGSFRVVSAQDSIRLHISEDGSFSLFLNDRGFLAIRNSIILSEGLYDHLFIDRTDSVIGFHVMAEDHPLTSSINMMGSIATKLRTVDGSAGNEYSLKSDDHIVIVSLTNESQNIVLPPVELCKGREYIIKRDAGGGNNDRVTIQAWPGDVIDEGTEYVIDKALGVVKLVCDGVKWWVISEVVNVSATEYSGNFTPASGDDLIGVDFVSDGQVIDLTLPTVANLAYKRYEVKRNVNGQLFSNNILRVIPVSGENLDQYTNGDPYLMDNNWESLTIQSNDDMWLILGNYGH